MKPSTPKLLKPLVSSRSPKTEPLKPLNLYINPLNPRSPVKPPPPSPAAQAQPKFSASAASALLRPAGWTPGSGLSSQARLGGGFRVSGLGFREFRV